MTVLPVNQSSLLPKPAVLQNWWVVFAGWSVVGILHPVWNIGTFQCPPERYRVSSTPVILGPQISEHLIQPFLAKLCLLQRREKMGSKMRVALGLGSRIWAATRKWEDPFLWKGTTFQTWNSTAIQIAMKIKEMECRRLSFYFSRF